MPQRSSHTLGKVVNPSRLLKQLSVWTKWIYEVVRFVDFWTQKNYSHCRLVRVCPTESHRLFMIVNSIIKWMHTDYKRNARAHHSFPHKNNLEPGLWDFMTWIILKVSTIINMTNQFKFRKPHSHSTKWISQWKRLKYRKSKHDDWLKNVKMFFAILGCCIVGYCMLKLMSFSSVPFCSSNLTGWSDVVD